MCQVCEREADACPPKIECSIEKALAVLDGKWTFRILMELFDGTRRFGELRRNLPRISPKTLSAKLRMLEEHHVIERRVYPTVPPSVEYTLTEKGRSLHPIIRQMKLWGARWG